MAKKTITGNEFGIKLLTPVRQMQVGEVANWVRDYGTRVLSERAPDVVNPSAAEMSVIVNDLRS